MKNPLAATDTHRPEAAFVSDRRRFTRLETLDLHHVDLDLDDRLQDLCWLYADLGYRLSAMTVIHHQLVLVFNLHPVPSPQEP